MTRLCRHICVLIESGAQEEAERVRSSKLAAALQALRTTAGLTDAEIDRQLASIFATEQERTANATVLAEILAPLLRERIVPAETVDSPRAPTARADSAPAVAARPRGTPGDIADFIDEMLAQERGPTAAGHRRLAT